MTPELSHSLSELVDLVTMIGPFGVVWFIFFR